MSTIRVSNNKDTYDVDESDLPKALKDGFTPLISVSKGSSVFDVHQEDLQKALADGFSPIQAPISKTESTLRGAAQGASLGFADEITGGGEAAFDKLKGDDASYSDLYTKHRDESRAAYDAAQKANPVSYGAGQLGGAVATVLIPGLGEMSVAKLAALGAAQGLGDSKAEDLSGMAKDTAIGGAIGAVTGVAAPYINKGLKVGAGALGDAGNWLLKKAGKVGAGIGEDVTERYLDNPDAVKNALSKEDLAQWINGQGGPIEQAKQNVSKLDSQAWDTLSGERKFPIEDVINQGQDLIDGIIKGKNGDLQRTSGVGASADKIKAIQNQLNEIKAAYGENGLLTEGDLKSVVGDLQKLAYGMEGSPKYTQQAEGIRQLSGSFNSALKEANPLYEKAMVPVADATSNLQDIQRAFVNKQNPDALDKTMSSLNTWNRKSDVGSAKTAVDYLDNKLGTGLSDDIQASLDKNSFNGTDTNGSRKTVLGGIVGGATGFMFGGPLGATIGSAVGGIAGQSADKYAGQMFQKVLDGKLAVGALADRLGPYTQVLDNALKRGPQAAAATHFILQQSDPEYRKRINQINGNN